MVTLANVGKATASAQVKFHDSQIAIGWKNQLKFKAQCERLASKAVWWALLRRYNVDFDLRRFDDDTSARDENMSAAIAGQPLTGESNYVASILPNLVATLSNSIDDIFLVHNLAVRFVVDFRLHPDFAAQKIIEFFLSPLPEVHQVGVKGSERLTYLAGSLVEVSRDARASLHRCEGAAKNILCLLKSPVQRAAVLRRCFTAFEASSSCGTDYLRLALVLSLYQNELAQAVEDGHATGVAHLYRQELEIVHRRLEALTILSSFFGETRQTFRPSFYGFFPSLPVPFDPNAYVTNQQTFDALGIDASGGFDPLKPLDDFLSTYSDAATASVLAPLCPYLGIPAGYIHARALMWRFRNSRTSNVPNPTFEGDVLPVLNKIRSSCDRTRLAEWCSHFFVQQDHDMLACLESALNNAIAASKEAEAFRQGNPTDEQRTTAERQALETVKRICLRKNALSDKVEIKQILRSKCSNQCDEEVVASKIVEELVSQLHEIWYENESSPEILVDFLLEEGSLLAANACLDETSALSMSDLRALSYVVKRACDAIADQHSHVHTSRLARLLAKRWLVHGDQAPSETHQKSQPDTIDESINLSNNSFSGAHHDDDTVNFIMDLASLGDDKAIWTSDSFHSQPKLKFTSDEEPALLIDTGSSREASEIASRRTALRIAFVLAFADDDLARNASDHDENTQPGNNPTRSKVATFGLLPLTDTQCEARRRAVVMDHCRELLLIVFATEDRQHGIADVSNLSDSRSDSQLSKRDVQKTLTFAMKHRALRVASILCPQHALEQCMREEGFIGEAQCSLKKCVFGAFVAKEIEEMKLSLPHSDLVHLSEMHHPTYARTLWRQHRCGGSEGNKGRLLLLLVEMCLRDESTIDVPFLTTVLNELARSQLPRSTLLACECLVSGLGENGAYTSYPELWNAVTKAMESASSSILTELYRIAPSANEHKSLESGTRTARRLCQVFRKLNETHPQGHEILSQFIIDIIRVLSASHDETFGTHAATIAMDAIGHVKDREVRKRFEGQVSEIRANNLS